MNLFKTIKTFWSKLFTRKQITINIQTIDAQSFCQLLEQNKDILTRYKSIGEQLRDRAIAFLPLRSGKKVPVIRGTL